MRTPQLLLASALAAGAMLCTTAVSASAQETTIRDLRADVVRYDGENDETGTILDGPTSIGTGIDAKSARFKHTKASVAVKMRFSKLTGSRTYTYATIRVKGSTRSADFWVFSNGSKTRGKVYDHKFRPLCSIAFTTRSGDNGTINFVVPRSCVGKPKSIKIQVGVSREITHGDALRIYDESISATRYRTTSSTPWLASS